MPAGRYLRTLILGWIAGDDMPAAPASVWLHLCTSAPSATAVGAAPTTTNYAPREITPADWAAIATGASVDTLSPTAAVRFPASGNFAGSTNTVTHAMLMDGSNPATANLLDYGALLAPRDLTAGGFVEFAAGEIDVTA